MFEPVSLQSVEELTPFSLALVARDPDTPPQTLTFTLVSGPGGLQIHPATGLLTWTPTEAQGPNSYNVVVRATEAGPAGRSSTLTFSIVVSERNEAPTLAAVPDFTVAEGTTLTFTGVAADTDLPPQRLTFSLEGAAPPGASVDPDTGVFTWRIGDDAGASTNLLTLRVTDDALEPKSASRSFRVTVLAQPRIVLNEIHYRAAAGGAEFVELYNPSTNTAWSLSGWRLTGTAFTFPASTTLGPDAYLVVARNRTAFLAAYPSSPAPVLGNYIDQLSADGGTIELRRPLTGGGEAIVSQVAFRTRAPGPWRRTGPAPRCS
ncbi:MAG: lamin tail domain-containing protein [Verrucomicrobia bacterium]|nr:lamin tail domain-containing protein [Verrucomicrobiota bacterium]